jgi:hypothetical protein
MEETLKNQVDKMIWTDTVSQPLSLAKWMLHNEYKKKAMMANMCNTMDPIAPASDYQDWPTSFTTKSPTVYKTLMLSLQHGTIA